MHGPKLMMNRLRDQGALNFYKNYDLVLETVYRKVLEKKRDGSVLDIGVGTGNLSRYFLKAFDVTGVDQSKEMLFKAKRKFPNLKLRVGEFLKLPFGNQSFDFIVSSYAFHHLTSEEKEHALIEMMRVLNDEGMIVIADMMFLNKKSKEYFCSKLSSREVESVEDEFYTDIEQFTINLSKLGFDYEYEQMDELMFIMKITK